MRPIQTHFAPLEDFRTSLSDLNITVHRCETDCNDCAAVPQTQRGVGHICSAHETVLTAKVAKARCSFLGMKGSEY